MQATSPTTAQLTVDPLLTPSGFRCSGEPGAMRSYVATLLDWSAPIELGGETFPFTVASSPPIPCRSRVTFSLVSTGRRYKVVLDGYEQDATDLTPVGGHGSGSRHMRGSDKRPVTPRWIPEAACEARGPEPTAGDGGSGGAGGSRAGEGGDSGEVRFDGFMLAKGNNVVGASCPLVDSSPTPGATAVVLDLERTLGDQGCTVNGVDVASFDVIPAAPGLPSFLDIPCPPDPEAPIVYELGGAPARSYFFRVEAQSSGGDHAFGASCFAVTEQGLKVTASCDRLSDVGALSIDIAPILSAEGLQCGDGAASYRGTLTPVDPAGQERSIGPVGCGERSLLAALAPGVYATSIEVSNAAGGAVARGTCQGEIRPGATAPARCLPSP